MFPSTVDGGKCAPLFLRNSGSYNTVGMLSGARFPTLAAEILLCITLLPVPSANIRAQQERYNRKTVSNFPSFFFSFCSILLLAP